MRAEPCLSVVTISYKDLDGLRRTTESVARQSYGAIEHIVIDGGSGPEVTDYLTRTSPSYWESTPDRGRYDAMNKGIAHATGDVVWLMHSGDCFSGVDAAAVGMAALGARPRSRWAYGKARIVGDPNREGLIWGYTPFDLRGFALGIRPIPHQATLFGADLLDRLGPYDTEFGLAADHLYMLGAATVEHPVVIDEILCDFDAGGAGSTRSQRDHYDDIRRAWDRANYYPFGRKDASTIYSKMVELTARAKQVVRGKRVGAGEPT